MSRYPIPYRLNLAIIGVQITAAFGIFWLASIAREWWQIGLLAVLFSILGTSIYNMMHEAEHGILVPSRFWNDLLGVILCLFFPASFHLLRQSHLGHHYRNRSDDEAFDYYFAGDNPVWKWLQLYGILTGVFWIVIVFSNVAVLFCPFVFSGRFFHFDRPTAALMETLNPRYWRLIQLEAAGAIAFHLLIVWLFQIPIVSYLAIYLCFGVTWSTMQYVHHFGTGRDVVHGTRNLRLWWLLDLLWLNHMWHHTHHEHPTIPWLHLPAVSMEKNAKRESLILHYLRMWCGPRYTDEHVENRYAGRIIR